MDGLALYLGQFLCAAITAAGLDPGGCWNVAAVQSIGYTFFVFLAVAALCWKSLRVA